ncbi:hypothetical protein K1T71_014300 [Dendrolimus kikuchii]|uniref:Uncharacterized protein n=1 Tax=Dendrolimus kikuchii TaxID=765133 RepID=A0ACC1CFM6_9NEOP|nr:hypothetical protein K1T71_014300 [Dendrolimus kikuchii]
MDNNQEYHDPDYPEPPVVVKEEPQAESETQKLVIIKKIIRREFSNELEVREDEVMQIEQRLTSSRRLLHRLRYAIVSAYYNEHKLKMTNGQIEDEIAAQRDPRSMAEIASLLQDCQRPIHPSVKKLLGKQTVNIEEIFKSRAPRNKVRRDYSAMLQTRNYTIRADSTKTLRPESQEPPQPEEPCTSKPKKVPRHLEPKIMNVVTLDEATRNKMKHRYRIVIGNTSKYAPAASNLDRSTHKWLLYIRGPPQAPDLRRIVTSVTVTLHHSYAPHHTVHLSTQEMLEYEYTEKDKYIDNEQTQTDIDIPYGQIEPKQEPIDTNYENDNTDNWLDFFNKETSLNVDEMIIRPDKIKEEVQEMQEDDLNHAEDANYPEMENNIEDVTNNTEGIENKADVLEIRTKGEWISSDIPDEILTKPTSPKKRIMKYLDPTTGKVYYLEMDRNLDLSKVQEIVINNKSTKISPLKSNGLKSYRKKKSVSLLKPDVRNLTKSDSLKRCLAHIENDHCYTMNPSKVLPDNNRVASDKSENLYNCLCSVVCRLRSVRAAVNYLVKKIPLISDQVKDPEFLKNFPFVVESNEKFWKLDFAKRRNIEWSRAKLINKILSEHFLHSETIWRTKQILLYTRLHGFYPTRNETYLPTENEDWSSWQDKRKIETNIKEYYPSTSDVSTLSKFDTCDSDLTDAVNLTDSDVEIDVVLDEVGRVKRQVARTSDSDSLTVLPVESEEDRLRFVFLERKCADIGVELRNEDVGHGYSYSAVHAVMMSAVKSFAEELIRSALAAKLTQDGSALPHTTVWAGSSTSRTVVGLEHVYAGVNDPRLHVLTAKDMGTERKNTYAI